VIFVGKVELFDLRFEGLQYFAVTRHVRGQYQHHHALYRTHANRSTSQSIQRESKTKSLKSLDRFWLIFTTLLLADRVISKFEIKWSLKIPPHLKYVTTLPCEIGLAYTNVRNLATCQFFDCAGWRSLAERWTRLIHVWQQLQLYIYCIPVTFVQFTV